MSLVGFKAQNHPQQIARDHVDDRSLPADAFAILDREFNFTIDAAAAAHNAKKPRYYTRENSGLLASWAGERVYCNPPYSNIRPWVEKAWYEKDAELVFLLLPANRTEQAWWQDLIEPFRDRGDRLTTRFLRGRQRFISPGKGSIGPNERPPFGICFCIWK